MARPDDVVEMPALGRPFQLGMLYDCRREILVPGITLWDPDTLQRDVVAKSQCRTEFRIITSDSVDEKTSALNVSASLKASFLGGLVELDGSAAYLNDTKKSVNDARVTLQYSTTTEFKQLTMKHLGRKNVAYPDVFDQGTATHVVTAVLYGAQAFFVFDREVSKSESMQEVQGHLQSTIQKIPKVSAEGEGSLQGKDKETEGDEKLTCTFHGDFALEQNPVTYQEAVKIYATLPKMLGKEGEKAVPVRVWLYPLTKLDSTAAQMVREISIQLVVDTQTVLEQLNEADARCNDLAKDPVASTFPEIQEKIQKLQTLCKQHRQTFQMQLLQMLPTIRGGGREEGALVDLLQHHNRSPFNRQALQEFLKKKEQKMGFVGSYLSLLRDLEVVSSPNKFNQILLDPKNDFVLSFMFTSLDNKEPYLQELEFWLRKTFTGDTPDLPSASSSSQKEKLKLWFEDENSRRNIRKAAKAFSEFARVNSANGSSRFIVSSVQDEENPGASVYFYEDADLVSRRFEVPARPLPPQVGEIKPDSVQLMMKPAAYGRDGISSYRVEFRAAGQEKWVAVDTEEAKEAFTVGGLHPDTGYQFRYAAVTKVGLSEWSEARSGRTSTISPPRTPQQAPRVQGERPSHCRQVANEVRIVLVGRSGSGKSATGNTILGREEFRSELSPSSVTEACERQETEMDGRKILLVDTPGFFDTNVAGPETAKEIKTCMQLSSPGPHAIVQVVQLNRFTKEEKDVAQLIQKIFSIKAKDYLILLFTRKDDLQGRPLTDFLKKGDKDLQLQIKRCGERCLAFDNRAKGRERDEQVGELLCMIDDMVEKNGEAPHYTEEMLEKDEKQLKRWTLCSIL